MSQFVSEDEPVNKRRLGPLTPIRHFMFMLNFANRIRRNIWKGRSFIIARKSTLFNDIRGESQIIPTGTNFVDM